MKQSITKLANEAKIPNSGYMTKEVLKATEIVIVKEIIELNEIKACLSHFLASHDAQLYPVTAIDAKTQMNLVIANTNELKSELMEIREMLLPKTYEPKVINLMHNEDEIAAIAYFNKDRRFTINE